MTTYGLTFQEGPLGTVGFATYERRDFALVYASESSRLPSVHAKRARPLERTLSDYRAPVFLIADTLTLCFDEERVLVGLDAYTNDKLWEHRAAVAPIVPSARGRLRIEWHGDDDRARLPGTPRFIATPDLHRLHILLEPSLLPGTYFEVGQHLIVGLGQGVLQEIILTDLEER